jgi:hypothetical protein
MKNYQLSRKVCRWRSSQSGIKMFRMDELRYPSLSTLLIRFSAKAGKKLIISEENAYLAAA